MTIIDGKLLSNTIKEEIKLEVKKIINNGLDQPHLAAVLVGENPASKSYINSKIKASKQVGIKSTLVKLKDTVSEEELLSVIDTFNNDDTLHGYIVQLPLPKHINEEKINLAISPKKDVDGFHPVNLGRMTLGLPSYLPATPFGILLMLERYNIDTEGKHCVVLGRSHIVGTPISILLSRKSNLGNATVTLAHSRTRNLSEVLKSADILITAIGKAQFVKSHMVKPGAVIIDVGINRVKDTSTKSGYRVVGDVDFDQVKLRASHITPVPGGVGLMTVTSLLLNTLKAAKNEIY